MFPSSAKHLFSLYERDGFEIRAVGGWVRDTLRNIPAQDLDLCTTALPEETIALCNRHGLRMIPTGLKHGTVSIAVGQDIYEVTTLRIDKETDGRHALVEFTTDWQADAARRDFTINAMSMDRNGTIFDYFGGQEAIRQRRIIFVGNPEERIREDFLRILRYFRFKGRIGDRHVDSEIENVISISVFGLRDISAERVWMEMAEILSDSTGELFREILFAMYVTGVFEVIGISDSDSSNIDRAVRVRGLTNNPITVLAALTSNHMADRWKMSSDEQSLYRYLQQHRDDVPSLALLKHDATTKQYGPIYAEQRAAISGSCDLLDQIRGWELPTFPVRGVDLITIGHKPGPQMGQILVKLEDDWKQSDFKLTREDLLASL
jgi:tRNA nucleotidyltransferase (CCA-adding enzyme)